MNIGRKLYEKIFPECAANGLRPRECPGISFVILGVMNIVITLSMFFIGRRVANDEIIIVAIFIVTLGILLVSYSVSNGLKRVAIARRELEDERRKVTTIVRELTDGLLFLSPECRIQLVNQEAKHLLGIKENRVLGRPRGPELYEEFPSLKKILQWCPSPEELENEKDEPFEPVEIQVEFPAKRTLRVSTAGIHAATGETLGIIKVIHDMSREKELDEMKSEFLSVTSHQLRTPLSSLRWLLELLVKGKLGDIPKEQKEVLQKMDDMNLRMITLVEDLLGATRIEQGRMEYTFGECQVGDLARTLVDELEPQIQASNLELKLEVPEDLPKIKCDDKKIRLVLQNLVENAIRYTQKGTVSVRLRSEGENLMIEVEDTGIGLDKDEQRKIFMKFYRGDRAREIEPEGTGLGLYLIQNIVQKHNGTLSVESEKNVGSTFRVTLPFRPE